MRAPLTAAVVIALAAAVAGHQSTPGGFVLEHEAALAQPAPGPHDGRGETIGYSYFEDVPGYRFAFRKRVLRPGASIGYHLQREDEIYYVVSGEGRMTVDDRAIDMRPGDAVLTRPGSSHGIVQTGAADLVLIITYHKAH